MNDNEKQRSIWSVLYDFLDDLISATIPGAFFVLFCATVVITSNIYRDINLTVLSGSGWFVVMLVFSYCFGIIFFRLEIGKIDEISSRYIFYKGIGSDNNSFAFACALTDEKIEQWRACLDEIPRLKAPKSTGQVERKLSQPSIARLLPDAEYTIKLYPYKNLATKISDCGRNLYFWLFYKNRYQLLKKRKELYHRVCDALLTSSSGKMDTKRQKTRNGIKRKPTTLCALPNTIVEAAPDKQFIMVLLADKHKMESVLSLPDVDEKRIEETCAMAFVSKVTLSALLDLTNQMCLYSEFPYVYMAQYLADRGLFNQVKYVSWGYSPIRDTTDDAQTEQGKLAHDSERRVAFRSKNALNKLKTEAKKNSPYARFQIDKTEAHVRFMNAIWHSARLTRFCSLTLSILIAGLIYLQIIDISTTSILTQTALRVMPRIVTLPYFNMLIANVGFLLLSTYICFQIRSIIHYQRVREVVSLLLLKDNESNVQKPNHLNEDTPLNNP